jgi:two-component system sensor histidine kinase KdpD
MSHGNIYARDKVDTALANFFRPVNLAAMRQIGLRLVADSMARSRAIVDSPEDVLVAVSCGAATEELMRRGARLARRRGGLCLVVTVVENPADQSGLDKFRELAGQLGCSFATLRGHDPAAAILQAARDAGAEHVVVGESTHGTWLDRFRPRFIDRIIDGLPDADIHVIARVAK